MSTSSVADYDEFADIYDDWVLSAAVTQQNQAFYVSEYLNTEGIVVELGVGNGRIALEAVRQGKPVIGVDASPAMLAECKKRAREAGIAERMTLMHADIREFVLSEPAELIALPFHTIGHLVSMEDKRKAVCHIFEQIAAGGRFILDHFVFNEERAKELHAAPRLRAEYVSEATGRDVLLWEMSVFDSENQTMRLIAWTDELDSDGTLSKRRYRRLGFSWLHTHQTRSLLEEAGFVIEHVYGDFDLRPLKHDSPEQVWIARKP
jgi:SAM-dependent methyltransferase